MESDCSFCKLVSEGLPPHCIFEDEQFFVMLDRESLGFGHSLVIPKVHMEKVYDLENDTYTSLFNLAKRIVKVLIKGTGKKAIAYVSFGTGIPHTHLHLVPLDSQDVLINPIKYLRKLSDEELQKEADKIKECL